MGDGASIHPFVLSVQSLRREIEFMEPFTDESMKVLFAQAEPAYKSATALLAQAEQMILGESEVAPGTDQLVPLVDYHLNLLKIHRLLFTRAVEGYGLIPPASPTLQRQVIRTYEALGRLTYVLTSLSKVPEAAKPKETKPVKSAAPSAKLPPPTPEEPEEPLDLPNRVSPFITDGSKKSTVSIDGVAWPRYV
jgi:hypothetical protein